MKIPFYFGKAYKFMTINGLLATIESESLRLTRGDMFNDPFESNPYLVPLEWDSNIPSFTENPELHSQLYNHAFKRIFSTLYITCFSKGYRDNQSKLMWSHYASNHSGVCIEIEFKPEQKNYMHPITVQYVEELVEERDKRNIDSSDLPLFLSACKADVWSYEREIRIVLEKEGYEKTTQKIVKTSNDSKFAYLPFDLINIKRIIFGVNSKKTDALKIIDVMIKNKIIIPISKLLICPKTLNLIEDENIDTLSSKYTNGTTQRLMHKK